jgi:hydrogenase nickel incorporation protein HypB
MVEIRIARKLTRANDEIAALNRELFRRHRLLAVNLLGSPGAGKTSLLESLAGRMEGLAMGVIEGDLETARDAERMERAGLRAVQITTGRGCHLHAGMVQDGLSALDTDTLDIIFVENVGNLVCPAGFDLGEDLRILAASVPEGDDKAAKYAPMFASAPVLAINKIDLLPYIDFDMDRFIADARASRPGVEIFKVSCRTGEGVDGLAGRVRKAFEEKFA